MTDININLLVFGFAVLQLIVVLLFASYGKADGFKTYKLSAFLVAAGATILVPLYIVLQLIGGMQMNLIVLVSVALWIVSSITLWRYWQRPLD